MPPPTSTASTPTSSASGVGARFHRRMNSRSLFTTSNGNAAPHTSHHPSASASGNGSGNEHLSIWSILAISTAARMAVVHRPNSGMFVVPNRFWNRSNNGTLGPIGAPLYRFARKGDRSLSRFRLEICPANSSELSANCKPEMPSFSQVLKEPTHSVTEAIAHSFAEWVQNVPSNAHSLIPRFVGRSNDIWLTYQSYERRPNALVAGRCRSNSFAPKANASLIAVLSRFFEHSKSCMRYCLQRWLALEILKVCSKHICCHSLRVAPRQRREIEMKGQTMNGGLI